MADISTLDEGIKAAEMGFDLIATTLWGYTSATQVRSGETVPNFNLIGDLRKELNEDIPVIAEGRIWTPEAALKALDHGAFAVVVGSAITRPTLITRQFAEALKSYRKN